MLPAGFEPAIPAGEQLQNLALNRSATGIGIHLAHNKQKRSDTVNMIMNLRIH
jgi:hypothetical protein